LRESSTFADALKLQWIERIKTTNSNTAEFLTFAYPLKGDGVEVRVQDGIIWLSQKNMGLLFDTQRAMLACTLKTSLMTVSY